MEYEIKNVTVIATPAEDAGGINLYIDFSGQQEYLFFYRFNYGIYSALKHGVTLRELERLGRAKPETRTEERTAHSARQILKIADDYIRYEYLPYRKLA